MANLPEVISYNTENISEESFHFSSSDHIRMCDKELYEQNEQYLKILNRSAKQLMEDGHIFPSLFLKTANGQIIVKVRNERSIPRKGEYLTAVVLKDGYGSFKKWGDTSWYDLRCKHQVAFSDAVCIWHAEADEPGFTLVGFKGISIDFADILKEKVIIVFGPQEPPREYILNLRKLAERETKGPFIDFDAIKYNWEPLELNNKTNFPEFVIRQLEKMPYMIVQGPPGTGKTYKIAQTVKKLLSENKSVLITALTNRALIEVVSKPDLAELLEQKRVFKTNLSLDELAEIPQLEGASSIESIPGTLMLSSFYITSGKALNIDEPIFDYVIMDEASQALLGMFQASIKLGRKVIWIGDQSQMPPITTIRQSDIDKYNFQPLIAGMQTLCKYFSIPSYIMNETYRLSKRAAAFTSKFYIKPLIAQKHIHENYTYPLIEKNYQHLFHPDGGPSWLKINMKIGDLIPENGIMCVVGLANLLNQSYPKLKISILTKMKKTVHKLQQQVALHIGNKPEIYVDTVDRVQGMTCDVCLFFIPNCKVGLSLNSNFFNVATSRALRHTIIISDGSIIESSLCIGDVLEYFNELDLSAKRIN